MLTILKYLWVHNSKVTSHLADRNLLRACLLSILSKIKAKHGIKDTNACLSRMIVGKGLEDKTIRQVYSCE